MKFIVDCMTGERYSMVMRFMEFRKVDPAVRALLAPDGWGRLGRKGVSGK